VDDATFSLRLGLDSLGTSTLFFIVHGKDDFPASPLLTDLHKDCTYEPQAGCFNREDAHHSRPTFDLLTDPFEPIRRSEVAPVLLREGKHYQSFRKAFLHPRWDFGGYPSILRYRSHQRCLCQCLVRRIEHDPDVFRYFLVHRFVGDILTRVLLQVKLTPLPWNISQYSSPGSSDLRWRERRWKENV